MGETCLQPGEYIRPKISQKEVEEFIEKLYGLKCETLKELNGYDDKNYYIKVGDMCTNLNISNVNADGYVLKIINSLDSKKEDLFEAQTQMLLHLVNQKVCCPTPVKNVDGKYHSIETLTSGKHIVRLLEYIPGSILHEVPVSNELLYQCGEFAAKLDEALQTFQHPAYTRHKTLWMLGSIPELKNFYYVIKDERKQKLVKQVVEEFENRVLSVSNSFEKGMIHGDFNEQNVIVEKNNDGNWKIKCILDFGDSHFDCYLYELAIALTYMMLESKSLDSGGYVLAGFTKVKKLPQSEINLLRICVAARLCQSLVLGAYSYLQDPNNTYVLTTAERGWELLDDLWSKSDEDVLKKWKTITQTINKTV